MFSRRRTNSKSDSLPSTKRSFASRLKPLFRFQRSNQTTTRNVYVQQPPLNGVYPPSVPSHQFALPVSPSPQTPFGLPPTPQGVYSAPRMGFSPVIPLPESPSPFVRRTDHLPFSPARPAVHLQMAGLQPTSLSRRGQWLDPMLGSIPEHMHVAMHSMEDELSSSRQAPHLGLQTFPSVSVGAVESSLHGHAHAAGLRHNTTRSVDHATLSGRQHEHEYEQQFWFPNRRSKPLSPEYLATPLSDNPLGLSGMVPVYVYHVEDEHLSLLIRLAVKATTRRGVLPCHKFLIRVLVRVPRHAGNGMLIVTIRSTRNPHGGTHPGPHKNTLPVTTVTYQQPGPGLLQQTLRLTRPPRPMKPCRLPIPPLFVHPKRVGSTIWPSGLLWIFTVPYASCRSSRLLPPLHAAMLSMIGVQLTLLIEDTSAKGTRWKRAIRQQ